MGAAQIAPAPVATRPPVAFDHEPTTQAADFDPHAPIVYEFAQRSKLHTVDLKRSLKSELLSASAAARWNDAVRRLRVPLIVCHNLVYFLTPVAIIVPTTVGRGVALLSMPLSLPGCTTLLLSMRYDVLYVLLGTYDFWFYWIIALVTCASLGLYVGDARAIAACFIALGMLLCLLTDASISLSLRAFMLSSILSGVLGCVVVLIVQFQLTPDVSTLTVSHNGRTVSLPDIIVNGIGSLLVVLVRNTFRHREAVLQNRNTANESLIQCVSIRCTLKLQCVSTAVQNQESRRQQGQQSRHSSVPHLRSSRFRTDTGTSTKSSLHVSEMKLVPIDEQFDGRRLLLGYQHSTQPWSRAAQWTLAVVVMSALLLTGVLYFYDVIFEQPSPISLILLSCVMSCLVSQVVWALLQPILLLRLWTSFDFLFLSFQLMVLHVCICDTLEWDRRALLCFTGLVWIHIVLVLDALAPITRRRIGFHKAFAMIVAVSFTACHVGYLAKLLTVQHWQLYDRVLVDTIWFGCRLHVCVIPLIFSRQPILIAWSLRLLWRVYNSQDGELILIRGAVAYESFRHKHRTQPTT